MIFYFFSIHYTVFPDCFLKTIALSFLKSFQKTGIIVLFSS